MTKKKRKPRLPGTRSKVTAEELEFGRAVLTKCVERGLPPDAPVPEEVVEEVVTELYGGWTPQARGFVRRIEEDDKHLPPD